MVIKFRSKRFSMRNDGGSNPPSSKPSSSCEIKWELRPGGMLVQTRDAGQKLGDPITIRVCRTGNQCHHIPIQQTSTFAELKTILSMVTKLKPAEQRLLFRGKEREDTEHLHMVGVGDQDKVLLLQDPVIKERKNLLASDQTGTAAAAFRTITV